MTDFLTFLLSAPFTAISDGGIGVVVGGLFLLVEFLVILAAIVGLYWLANFTFAQVERSPAKIIGKDYIPPYTTFMLIWNGSTNTPMPQFHPAQHIVTVQLPDGRQEGFDMDEESYSRIHLCELITIEFQTGRFDREISVKSYAIT